MKCRATHTPANCQAFLEIQITPRWRRSDRLAPSGDGIFENAIRIARPKCVRPHPQNGLWSPHFHCGADPPVRGRRPRRPLWIGSISRPGGWPKWHRAMADIKPRSACSSPSPHAAISPLMSRGPLAVMPMRPYPKNSVRAPLLSPVSRNRVRKYLTNRYKSGKLVYTSRLPEK